jgi:putative hydrolase of the HAD superfamily
VVPGIASRCQAPGAPRADPPPAFGVCQAWSVAVLFCDLDDTLIDRAAGFRSWATAFLERHDVSAERSGEVAWLAAEDRDGSRPRDELLEAARARYAITQPVESLVRTYRGEFPSYIPLPAPATLAALELARRQGWKTALVTNGTADQQAKIAHAGLAGYLDACVISAVAGCRKPDPEIFRIAAARCGGTLDGGWMVGDSADADVAGALASGVRSVWIDRGRPWPERTFAPTLSAATFAAAVDAIVAARVTGP